MKYECIKFYSIPFDADRYIDRAIASAQRNNATADPPPDRRQEREARADRYTSAGRIVDQQARAHMTKHGGSYPDAVRAVLDADADLKAAYAHGDPS